MGWYNGFSEVERSQNLAAIKQAIDSGELVRPTGPCQICGDPSSPVEYHSEDYSLPYRWTPPAMYVLCLGCHRNKLHQRFYRPELWQAFLAHVRRGGYSRDLREPDIKSEFALYRRALAQGLPASLRMLRPYPHTPGEEWFAHLRMDVGSLHDPAARPRR